MSTERVYRGMRQRMYLLSIKKSDNGWNFLIEGASGHNYYLYINQYGKIGCNCPDFSKRQKICKHLYFIIGRIAQLDSMVDYIKGNKVEFNHYQQITKALICRFKQPINQEKSDNNVKIGQESDDNCIICFESLSGEPMIQCVTTCKNYFHQACINIWLTRNANCPLCRANWSISNNKNEELLLLSDIDIIIKPKIKLHWK